LPIPAQKREGWKKPQKTSQCTESVKEVTGAVWSFGGIVRQGVKEKETGLSFEMERRKDVQRAGQRGGNFGPNLKKPKGA